MSGISSSTLQPAATDAIAASEPLPLQIEELTQRCMGSLALVERLLASFEQRFPVEVSELSRTLEQGDATRLARSAHQLKGAAANLSAPALRSTFERIEHAARANELAPIAGYLSELDAQWERFCQYRAATAATASASA